MMPVENFLSDEPSIISWLNKYKVKSYTLVLDDKYGFKVNVDADVDLSEKKTQIHSH